MGTKKMIAIYGLAIFICGYIVFYSFLNYHIVSKETWISTQQKLDQQDKTIKQQTAKVEELNKTIESQKQNIETLNDMIKKSNDSAQKSINNSASPQNKQITNNPRSNDLQSNNQLQEEILHATVQQHFLSTHVVGEIKNNRDTTIHSYQLNVTFYNKDGSVVGSGSGSFVQDISPGQTLSFDVKISNPIPRDSVKYKVVGNVLN